MKIILLQDVKSLGKKGEIIEASDGYAKNFILPKKLGVEANGKNLNDLKLQKANEEKIAKEQLEAAQAFAEEMKTKKVTVKMKAGEGGKVFGSISSKEIAQAAKSQYGMEIVRSFGVYEVGVKLHPKVTGQLKVHVLEDQ